MGGSGEGLTLGSESKIARLARTLDERVRFLKYLGFALWIAWFGTAYGSAVWVDGVEATSSVIFMMFFISTACHALAMLAFALFPRFTAALERHAACVVVCGAVACVGCVFLRMANPFTAHSFVLFCLGCALTGIGTAMIGLRAGLLLCAAGPKEALTAILYCEIIAALVQFMAMGLPKAIGVAVFIALPLLSGLCLSVPAFGARKSAEQEDQRLKPPKAFYPFLVVAGILAVMSNFSKGLSQALVSPERLAADGAIASLAVIVCMGVLALVVAVRTSGFDFGHLFYPAASVLLFSLVITYVLPSDFDAGAVISAVAFQLFDAVMWYAFAHVVYQSKSSGIRVIASGRAAISFGVTVGAALGYSCSSGFIGPMGYTMLFTLLFAAGILVFVVFSERRIDALLLPIPDEDEPGFSLSEIALQEGRVVSGQESGPLEDERANASVGAELSAETGDDEAGRGRWKRLCLALADEAQLTDREKEVLVLLARGCGSQTISDQLTVSLYTTRAHTRNIYAKLDVHSRQELSSKVNEYVRLRS